MKLFKQKNNKGFSLVEVLIAISIFTMTIVTMMSVIGGGIADVTYARQKMVASYLAQEGIEYIRNQRDSDVLGSISTTGNGDAGWSKFITDFTPPAVPTYAANPDFSGFKRTIQTIKINNDEVQISSTVQWTLPSGTQRVTFSEDLFNWE